MRQIILLGTLSLALLSCNSSDTAKMETNHAKEEMEMPKVHANTLLSLEIDGMVCQMGCGGSIRKELKATGAVATVEFDFEEERKTNTAKVAFDKEKITGEEIVKILSQMNDQQFTIGKTAESTLEMESVDQESTTEGTNKETISMSTSFVEMPNLLDLLSGFLRN